MAASDQTILDNLRDALNAIVSGGAQSYSTMGRTWTALDIDKLSNLIDHYQARVNRANRKMMAVGTFREVR